jgi:toxin-antitoxin system PIN domain toxin
VILIDANILIYAGVSSVPEHERARQWLDEQLSGPTPVGLPWHSLLAYLRITTNPRSVARPQRMKDAWRQVQDWLSSPPAWVPAPTERHAGLLRQLCESADVYGDLVPDAHLAALAMEHGLTVCSSDRDFARFPRLRWMNPLAEG